MELKDWVILLIPILCNGFFIFCFQLFISHMFKKREKHDELMLNILNTFSTMVCDQYEDLMHLIHECSPGYNTTETMKHAPFNELWNPIADKTIKIYNFYQIHETILQRQNISIKKYGDAYDLLAKTLAKKIDILLTDKDRQEIFQQITVFVSSIVSLNAQLEQIIFFK